MPAPELADGFTGLAAQAASPLPYQARYPAEPTAAVRGAPPGAGLLRARRETMARREMTYGMAPGDPLITLYSVFTSV